jgi:hypothetical protein
VISSVAGQLESLREIVGTVAADVCGNSLNSGPQHMSLGAAERLDANVAAGVTRWWAVGERFG